VTTGRINQVTFVRERSERRSHSGVCQLVSASIQPSSYYTANLASHDKHENGRQVGRVRIQNKTNCLTASHSLCGVTLANPVIHRGGRLTHKVCMRAVVRWFLCTFPQPRLLQMPTQLRFNRVPRMTHCEQQNQNPDALTVYKATYGADFRGDRSRGCKL